MRHESTSMVRGRFVCGLLTAALVAAPSCLGSVVAGEPVGSWFDSGAPVASDAAEAAHSDVGVVPCGGADLQTDAHNCGACGHDCVGGACFSGLCQPVMLGHDGAYDLLTASDGYLYWAQVPNPARVVRMPTSGGAAEVVYEDADGASGLTIDGSVAYIGLFSQRIIAVPSTGSGAVTVIATEVSHPEQLEHRSA